MKVLPGSALVEAADGFADLDQVNLRLRYGEIEIHRIEFLQVDQRRTGADVLTQVDLTDTQAPGKRRADSLLRNHGLLRGHLRLRAFQVGRIGIDRSLADGLHLELRQITLIILLRQCGGGFELFQLGDLRCRVELDQHLPGFAPWRRIQSEWRTRCR